MGDANERQYIGCSWLEMPVLLLIKVGGSFDNVVEDVQDACLMAAEALSQEEMGAMDTATMTAVDVDAAVNQVTGQAPLTATSTETAPFAIISSDVAMVMLLTIPVPHVAMSNKHVPTKPPEN